MDEEITSIDQILLNADAGGEYDIFIQEITTWEARLRRYVGGLDHLFAKLIATKKSIKAY